MDDSQELSIDRKARLVREEAFRRLIKIEPRLQELYLEAQRVSADTPEYNEVRVWYERFKPRLLKLVGYHAENPVLRNSADYDVAYRMVLDALPREREWSEEEMAEWWERQRDNG